MRKSRQGAQQLVLGITLPVPIFIHEYQRAVVPLIAAGAVAPGIGRAQRNHGAAGDGAAAGQLYGPQQLGQGRRRTLLTNQAHHLRRRQTRQGHHDRQARQQFCEGESGCALHRVIVCRGYRFGSGESRTRVYVI